jgi:hypothetical protein
MVGRIIRTPHFKRLKNNDFPSRKRNLYFYVHIMVLEVMCCEEEGRPEEKSMSPQEKEVKFLKLFLIRKIFIICPIILLYGITNMLWLQDENPV